MIQWGGGKIDNYRILSAACMEMYDPHHSSAAHRSSLFFTTRVLLLAYHEYRPIL